MSQRITEFGSQGKEEHLDQPDVWCLSLPHDINANHLPPYIWTFLEISSATSYIFGLVSPFLIRVEIFLPVLTDFSTLWAPSL